MSSLRTYVRWLGKATEFANEERRLKKELPLALAYFRSGRPLPQQADAQAEEDMVRFYQWFLLDRHSSAYREAPALTWLRKRGGKVSPKERERTVLYADGRIDLFTIGWVNDAGDRLGVRSRTAAEDAPERFDDVVYEHDAVLTPGASAVLRLCWTPEGECFVADVLSLGDEGAQMLLTRHAAGFKSQGIAAEHLEAVLQGVTEIWEPIESQRLRLEPRAVIIKEVRALLDEGRLSRSDAELDALVQEHDDAKDFAASVVQGGDFPNQEAFRRTMVGLLSLWSATPRASFGGRAPRQNDVPASAEAAMDRVRSLMAEELGEAQMRSLAAQVDPANPERGIQYVLRSWQEAPNEALGGKSPLAFVAEAGAREREAEQASKPARNKPCPCGSGKKYKLCCGQTA